MKKAVNYIVVLLALALFLPQMAGAEEKKLSIYTYRTKFEMLPIGFAKTPANYIFERRGVAVYEDGEVATYLGRGSGKLTPKGGTGELFCQYTFSDGATSVLKSQIQLVPIKKEGGKGLYTLSGKGSYISGSGRLEGIQGNTTFTGKSITPNSKEKGTLGDMVVDVITNYTLPAK